MKKAMFLAVAVLAVAVCASAEPAVPGACMNASQAELSLLPGVLSDEPAPAEMPEFTPDPLPATHPCHDSCTLEAQRQCRLQGGYCTLHPDFGFCGCYYP